MRPSLESDRNGGGPGAQPAEVQPGQSVNPNPKSVKTCAWMPWSRPWPSTRSISQPENGEEVVGVVSLQPKPVV